jgi:uncharacterized protein YqjF (DUF2071 family)
MQRVTLVQSSDGRRAVKFYSTDELNEMWGFCAKMVFLVPFGYSSMTVETVDDETYKAYVRAQQEREVAAQRARVAWSQFVQSEATEGNS